MKPERLSSPSGHKILLLKVNAFEVDIRKPLCYDELIPQSPPSNRPLGTEDFIMNTAEFWSALDEVCASPTPTLQISDLLRVAYRDDLPLLIACTRSPGRIHHSFANFDASNPGVDGNRYLICFTSREQAEAPHAPSIEEDKIETRELSLEEQFRLIDAEESGNAPSEENGVEGLSLEERFRLIDEGLEEPIKKKRRRMRRKKARAEAPLWKVANVADTALVSTRAVLDYARRSKSVGGLIFNVYDGAKAVALPKFMM